jgi:hypothetical protein
MHHCKQVGMVVTLYACISEVPGSNDSGDIEYPEGLWFYPGPRAWAWIVPLLNHYHFLPASFHFITCHPVI